MTDNRTFQLADLFRTRFEYSVPMPLAVCVQRLERLRPTLMQAPGPSADDSRYPLQFIWTQAGQVRVTYLTGCLVKHNSLTTRFYGTAHTSGVVWMLYLLLASVCVVTAIHDMHLVSLALLPLLFLMVALFGERRYMMREIEQTLSIKYQANGLEQRPAAT